MDKSFKVYSTDRPRRGPIPALAPDTLPTAFATEAEAIQFAFRALWQDRLVWRIEYPDGYVVTREQIELVFHKHPAGDPLPSLHQTGGRGEP